MLKYFLSSFLLMGTAFAQECSTFWIEADYLLWFIKKNPVPVALVTSASLDDQLPGAIGQPDTHIALGKKPFHMGPMQGFQLNSGIWGQCIGVEAGYFLLPTVSKSKSLTTSGEPGSPNYAVPIFDVSGVFGLNGIPGETIFLLPGPFDDGAGFSAKFHLRVKSLLQGAELNFLYRPCSRNCFDLDWTLGFRWFNLREMLLFKVNSLAAPNSSADHAFYNSQDRFKTTNHFLGFQLKLDGYYQINRWKWEALLNGMVGACLQKIKIQGSSQTSGGNVFFLTKGTANEILPGGIFAEPSNQGSHKKNPFTYGFETKLRLRFAITCNMEIALGYSFLWLSKVVRPGDQIDRKINSTETALADASRATAGIGPGPIPFGDQSAPAPLPSGPTRPKVPFKSTSFWAQGLDAGIQFNF